MKIPFAQLLPHLNQQLSLIYLVTGDEHLLVDTAKESIRQCAMQKGFTHREIVCADAGFNWQSFMMLAYNRSLFASQQIIELHLPQAKPGDSGSKILQEYASRPPRDKILIVTAPKIDSATQKSKWFKALEQGGTVVQVWPLENRNLLNWIINKAQQLGLNMSNNGAKIIADYTAGNLLATQQEIEKLSLLFHNATATPLNPNPAPNSVTSTTTPTTTVAVRRVVITDEQIMQALSDSAHFSVFDLVDAIYAQNKGQIINILEHLKDEGLEPVLVLWAIARELRLLVGLKSSTLASATVAGTTVVGTRLTNTSAASIDQILNSYGYKVKNENKAAIKKLITRFSLPKLENLLQQAADTDQVIKGVKTGSVWRELSKITLSLCIF